MGLNDTENELGILLASPPSHARKLSCSTRSSSTADTTQPQVKGARRVRNACLQCRERKIRCSRTYPCKGCMSRGDGAACDWQGGFPTGNLPNYQQHVAEQRRQFEELQHRILCARACLNSAVQRDLHFNLISQHQAGLSFVPPSISEQEPPWFSTGPHFQPPGSAASNISSFSTNPVGSSQCWSNEEFTEYSPSSVELNYVNPRRDSCPADFLSMRNKHSRYRPLSLLLDEDGQPLDTSRPYSARLNKITGFSPFGVQAPTTVKNVASANVNPHHITVSEPRRDSVSQSIDGSSLNHETSTTDVTLSLSRRQNRNQNVVGAISPFPLATVTASTESGWPQRLPRIFDKNHFFDNHSRRRSSQSCHLEPRSPVTPNRHIQSFNIPCSSTTANDNVPTNIAENLCHHYLPQNQYVLGQDLIPITELTETNFRSVPWGVAVPQNLDQAVQADLALGLMHGDQYCGFMPPGLSLGSIIDTTQMTTCNQNPHVDWDTFPS